MKRLSTIFAAALVTASFAAPAKWEKGAHEAFDRDIVPVFNQWVGLPGFAAIVDAKSKRVIGCVNSTFPSTQKQQIAQLHIMWILLADKSEENSSDFGAELET